LNKNTHLKSKKKKEKDKQKEKDKDKDKEKDKETEKKSSGGGVFGLFGKKEKEKVDHKAKLTEFYTNYAPDKVSTVDATLAKYKGKEDELWKQVEKKYADQIKAKKEKDGDTDKEKEKDTPKEKEKETPKEKPNEQDHRQRLTEFYSTYVPDKVSTVDATLAKYKNKEGELWKALEKKYADQIKAKEQEKEKEAEKEKESTKETETSPTDYRKRLVDFFTSYAPERLDSVDAALEKYKGKEEDIFKILEKKYAQQIAEKKAAPSTTTDTSDEDTKTSEYRKQLTEFYTLYAPDKLSTVETNLKNYKGKEEQMFKTLKAKYASAIEAKEKKEKEEEASKNKEKEEEKIDYRAKLVVFYEKHNPTKVHLVDKALSQYTGREDELFQKLYTSFGLDSNGKSKEEIEAEKSKPKEEPKLSKKSRS